MYTVENNLDFLHAGLFDYNNRIILQCLLHDMVSPKVKLLGPRLVAECFRIQ